MKIASIFSIVTLVLSILFVTIVMKSIVVHQTLIEDKVKHYVNQNKYSIQQSVKSEITADIEAIILESISHEMRDIDFHDIISNAEVRILLHKAAALQAKNSESIVALHGKDMRNVRDKVTLLVQLSQWPSDYYAEQIASLGEEAVPALIHYLETNSRDFSTWNGFSQLDVVEQALSLLLTEQDKELTFRIFRDYSLCSDLIMKHWYDESEKLVFEKLEHLRESVSFTLINNLLELSLTLNEEKAIPLLKKYAARGTLNADTVLTRLDMIPGIDLSQTLREAAENVKSRWCLSTIIRIMLKRGKPEGLVQAISYLKTIEGTDNYIDNIVIDAVRKYTGARGNCHEMAIWLTENRDLMKWDEKQSRFAYSVPDSL